MNTIISEDFSLLWQEYADMLKDLKGTSVLITGAGGMITSYLSRFLIYISEELSVTLYLQIRNIEKGKKTFAEELNKMNVHLIDFDFENNDIPTVHFDYIIHAASPASTKFFIECPVDVISPNTIGTWNLLQYAKNNAVKKFLFFSSNSIYGEGGIDTDILTENIYGIVDPLNSRSSYIESKRVAEQMCIAYWKQYGVPTSIIRICHTYGPTFNIDSDLRVIPRVIKQILANEDITIYKDPNSVIQYTYIADMIMAILHVLLKGENGEAYNAGGDEIVKMDNVIVWMVDADSSIESKLIEKEKDENYSFGKGKGVNFLKLSNDKIKGLGWKQLYKNEDGFKRTVKSYLQDYACSSK